MVPIVFIAVKEGNIIIQSGSYIYWNGLRVEYYADPTHFKSNGDPGYTFSIQGYRVADLEQWHEFRLDDGSELGTDDVVTSYEEEILEQAAMDFHG